MKLPLFIFVITLCFACANEQSKQKAIVVSCSTDDESGYLILASDTIELKDGIFVDTLSLEKSRYDYLKLENWKWPKLVYLDKNKDLKLKFDSNPIHLKEDPVNTFLLNIDSLLIPYTIKWDMTEEVFRRTIEQEMPINLQRIDSIFAEAKISQEQIEELKQIEKLKLAHRTANFISFQQRKGVEINRDIYQVIGDLNLNNQRLEFQSNNRNFQYYYLLDKVDDELPDSIYHFAVIDTVNKYSKIESIRKMIISSSIKSSFYSDEVDHDKLIDRYEKNFGKIESTDVLSIQYRKIQNLKPGQPAPKFGNLKNLNEEKINLDDLNGQNILVSVWGTWCPYCREELPALKQLSKKYGNKFKQVAISLDKDEADILEYIKTNDWDAAHFQDSERNSIFKSNYMVGGTNVHFLIDKKGVILSKRGLKPSSTEFVKLIESLK